MPSLQERGWSIHRIKDRRFDFGGCRAYGEVREAGRCPLSARRHCSLVDERAGQVHGQLSARVTWLLPLLASRITCRPGQSLHIAGAAAVHVAGAGVVRQVQQGAAGQGGGSGGGSGGSGI